ncbi:sensor histidine kinase [Paraconexibacter sp.]|uniref:sensor histidine kinase n=1 Tax=Paraconexibacter sp. TaxID=2949640 RepID=UPI0035679267
MPRSPHRVVLVTGALTALLIGALAVGLATSRGKGRSDLERSFEQRASIAAALVESILNQTASTTVAQNRAALSGRTIPDAVLRKQVSIPGQEFSVLDAAGTVIAAWPKTAGRRGDRIPVRGELRRVLDGAPFALTVAPPPGKASIISAFETPLGRRAAIQSFPRVLIQQFLGGYLGRLRTTSDDDAYLVDDEGNALGSASGSEIAGLAILPTDGAGAITYGGTAAYYAAARVKGTDWSVVLMTPQARLYAPVSGFSSWISWGLLLGVTGLALLVIALVRRLAQGSADLAEANRDLAARNEQVVAADRMKSNFLATMSHELRTPLNGIIGFAELMHDGRVGPVSDQHREYLGDILVSSNHLRRLIDDVLDLSKIEAGKIDLRPERVDCGAVVEEVCDVVGSLAVRKNIDLQVDVDPTISPLDLDPGKLKQVLFNYLSNALKFTPEGGTVSVTATREPEDRFRIVVEDNGPGISEEDLDRLWGAFEQLDMGSARRHGGTGLGLSLTRSIVEAQGGEVAVESTVGVGTRFHVVLPRVVRPVEHAVPVG